MTISSFDDLLRTAAAQAEPQRLLFLFAQKGEIEKRSGAAIDRSATISGGTLTPIMCVDKGLDELTSFDGLSQESEALGKSWAHSKQTAFDVNRIPVLSAQSV